MYQEGEESMFLKKYGDLAVGIVFTVLAVLIYGMASQLPPNLLGGVGSDFMPKIIAVGMGILGVLQCAEGVRTVRKEAAQEPEEEKPEYLRVLGTVVAFGIYVFTIKPIGFLPCSIVYLFAQMMILAPKEKRNILLFAGISVVFNVAVYYLFRSGLNVMLPTGILG